ncbi:MAG TPA: bifunctional nuclease family protein [Planctomycetaceae bacterium]|nr:bifunctional nuclease family protein [Planctomycetaceae bacterium]
MSSSEVEVDVCRIVINDVAPEQILYFREVDGERGLPFVLGIYEATSILRMLEGERTSRPLTHEAWLLTIETIGGKVAESAITRLVDRTYHAELRIANQSEIVRVDVRPSDAVAIALKANAPILIKAELLPEVAS